MHSLNTLDESNLRCGYIDCLVQDCSNPSALAMELLHSCAKLLICHHDQSCLRTLIGCMSLKYIAHHAMSYDANGNCLKSTDQLPVFKVTHIKHILLLIFVKALAQEIHHKKLIVYPIVVVILNSDK